MDFADYHYQERKAQAARPLRALCMNTTFYLTDNTPERGRLTFLKNYVDRLLPEELLPHVYYTDDRSNRFQAWCDAQPQEHLYPRAGDAIVFLSHIPHQGVKFGDDPEDDIRANLVLHFQQNAMYPGIKFVSSPDFTLETLGYAGTFPFCGGIAPRRRVGKTFLLSHFAQGKRAVFFGATQQAEAIELRRLTEVIRRDLGDQAAHLAGGGLPTWEAALQFFSAVAQEHSLLVILDEVPYLARSTPGFASIVQMVWDHLRPGTKLTLVLTGSAVGVMEEILGVGGALRGRPTLPLAPVDLIAAREFLPDLPAADLLQAYAACGGYPLHLRQWDARRSTQDNLRRLAFTPGGVLLEDADGILREELSPTGGYAQILAAIGRGPDPFLPYCR